MAGTPLPVPTTLKKLPLAALAEHRYGREEMLALLLDDPPLPPDLSKIPVLSHAQPLQPLALIPFTEVEQVKGVKTVLLGIKTVLYPC